MTEGIIQEVFNPIIEEFWLEHHEDYCEDNESGYTKASRKRLDTIIDLQKRLIEKIKQEFPITEPFLHVYGAKRVRRMLIGDNQE